MAGGRDICGDSHSCLPDMTTCLHYDIIQIQKQKKNAWNWAFGGVWIIIIFT